MVENADLGILVDAGCRNVLLRRNRTEHCLVPLLDNLGAVAGTFEAMKPLPRTFLVASVCFLRSFESPVFLPPRTHPSPRAPPQKTHRARDDTSQR